MALPITAPPTPFDWQCPICLQSLSDAEAAIVPCILLGCVSATHPICVDCCWEMRARDYDFRCPICTQNAASIMPIHCMVAPNNSAANEKIARAEADLRPEKEITNASIAAQRKKFETFIKTMLLFRPIFFLLSLIMCGTFCFYLLSNFILALVELLMNFITRPWGLLTLLFISTLLNVREHRTERER